MSNDANILDGSPLDESQRSFCREPSSSVRLLAPAGSGKTLSILWRCLALQKAPDPERARFLVFTFTRAARDELRERIRTTADFEALRSEIEITTLNAWGLRRLKEAYPTLRNVREFIDRDQGFWTMVNDLQPLWQEYERLRTLLTDKRRRNKGARGLMRLMDALKGLGFRHDKHNEPERFASHALWLRDSGMSAQIRQALAELAELEIIVATSEDVTADSLQQAFDHFGRFWCDACLQLYRTSKLTFDDQKYWALVDVEAAISGGRFTTGDHRCQHIFVDEFQDINPLDLNLIKAVRDLNRAAICIVGDDDQAIYEWRGATPEFILFPDQHIGGSFKTHTLGVNYRCPDNIVGLSQRLIAHNKRRVPKDVKPGSTMNSKIEIFLRPTIEESVEQVRQVVHEMLGDPEIQNVALIGRKRSQIIPYQIIFAAENVPFYAADDLNVWLSDAFKQLKKILLLRAQANHPCSSGPDPVESLLKIADKVKRYPLSKADRQLLENHLLRKRPTTLVEAHEALNSHSGPIIKGAASIYAAIGALLSSTTVAASLNAISQHFTGLQKDYGRSLDDIFYVDPPFLYLADYARRYGDDFVRFLEDVEKAIATLVKSPPEHDGSDPLAEQRARPLHLMTALRAKGKEFDGVVILDCNEGIWPSRLASTEAQLEEERRLFYVALTRVQRRLILMINEQILGEYVPCSPYLAEADFAKAGVAVPEQSLEQLMNQWLNESGKKARVPKKDIKKITEWDLESKIKLFSDIVMRELRRRYPGKTDDEILSIPREGRERQE